MPNQDKKPRKKMGDGLEGLVKNNIDISSRDFFDKYHLIIDGEKITEAELKLIIESIRMLRKNGC